MENTMYAPVIEFEGKGTDVKTISKEDLQRSIRRESGLAGIRSIPVQYWKIYDVILAMLRLENINYREENIYIQNNSSKAYLTDEEKALGYTQKKAPINRWRFDKIVSTIQLPNLVGGDAGPRPARVRNGAIGLTLNKEGLSVAFGMNIQVCSNFNVLGGTVMRSYGSMNNEGLPWDVMEVRLRKWINEHQQIWQVQNEIMTAMIQTQLPKEEHIIEQVIGDLYVRALEVAYFKGGPVPFNTYELSDFVQEAIRQRKNEESLTDVWDLYNWGTSIMKPGKMDIGEISNNSNMWADYLIDRFALDVPSYEIIEV